MITIVANVHHLGVTCSEIDESTVATSSVKVGVTTAAASTGMTESAHIMGLITNTMRIGHANESTKPKLSVTGARKSAITGGSVLLQWLNPVPTRLWTNVRETSRGRRKESLPPGVRNAPKRASVVSECPTPPAKGVEGMRESVWKMRERDRQNQE